MAHRTQAYNAFEVYEDGENLVGIAKVTLPTIPHQTQNINGAGISGNIESVVVGMIDVMNATFNFVSATEDAVRILSPKKHVLTLMASEQYWDTESAEKLFAADKIVILGAPKTLNPGDFAPATTPNVMVEYSVHRYEGYRDGTRLWLIDPFNYICEIGGVDYMADIRKAVGKA